MNINRFLSRREKDGSSHKRDKSRDKSAGDKKEKEKEKEKTRPNSSDGIFTLFKADPQKKVDRELSNKINMIKLRLHDRGYTEIEDEQIHYALSSKHANGDLDMAFEMMVLFQESVEGIIKPYNPAIHMRGAENREFVTCFLDALLFAMFARLGSFEPILYTDFEDEHRRRLSTLIRLWVNMLRTGKFIQTDVTQYLQEALAACGWEDAALLEQQDTSEAFNFITEKLELPLLTLKMDIFHTGKEDPKDDHKLVHERLLEVAVPDEPPEGSSRPIRLEDCLESYFNNRVEVVRRLERSNTLSSIRSGATSPTMEKEWAQHVEVVERSTPNTPASDHPPSSQLPPITQLPPATRLRSTSIIRQRVVEDDGKEDHSDTNSTRGSIRKGSKKEVMMPAWQFFNLIPWYTRTSPTNDAEVAAHFSQTRPVLGICLKRYGITESGRPFRKNTFIDIPLDIRLPHFIQDEMIAEDGPLMGDFKLSLQSVICHRGNSVNAGHYISFIRGTSQIADGDSQSARRLSNNSVPPHYSADRWIKFDDLADPRVSYVDIEQAMKDEMPYLLFYQVQPTYDCTPPPGSLPGSLSDHPPSYSDSAIGMKSHPSPPRVHGYFDVTRDESMPTIRLSSEIERPPTPRRSINLPESDRPLGPEEDRRGSLAFTETSLTSTDPQVISAPPTPNEETTAQRMSRAAARFTKSGSKSRPTSATGENRISATFSRLNLMRSKEQLNRVDPSKEQVNKIDLGKEMLIPATDGAGDSRTSITIEENDGLKPEEETINRSKSKKSKKKKGKEKAERVEHEGHHGHHMHKEKGKNVPDRECKIM